MKNDRAFLADVYKLLEKENIETWMFGGWAEELRRMIMPREHNNRCFYRKEQF